MRMLIIFIIGTVAIQCTPTEEIIMLEDFEGEILWPFHEQDVMSFQGNKILGNFNNEQIIVRFQGLQKHSEVNVSFDLYIHDSWDGNTTGVNGPDTWSLALGKNARKVDEIHTSFSNSSCNTAICLLQSYPQQFPYPNDPKTSVNSTMPGLCHFQSKSDGTTLYTINYTFRHSNSQLYISMYDELIQTNSQSEKCDESWSIDNLLIEIQ